MIRKWIVMLLMMIGVTLISGCWSKKELTDLALIAAFGIDLDKEGRYVGTLQIVNPSNVAGSQQPGGGGGQGTAVSVLSTTGDNLDEVSRRASTKISRRLYYAHANVIVISEKLAKKEGINSILDAFDRDPEFRNTATLVIARGTKSADICRALTIIDKIPANKIIKTLKTTENRWGENIFTNIQDVMKSLVSDGKEPVITGIQLNGDPRQAKNLENLQVSSPEAILQTNGLGVFKDGKLIDWFNGKRARGVVWILNKIKSTDVNINWREKKDAIAYEVIREKTSVSATMKNGNPRMSIHVRAEGNIGEARAPVNLTDPGVLKKIEKVLKKEIKHEIQDAVQAAQKNKADIFGFGEAVHRSAPDEWKKMKLDWNDKYFPKLKVNVKVEAFVRRTGLRNKPYSSNIGK
ncbi:Ger(x)C family spore germination protein [Fictibacillus sp. Mic-4]|uniref:Ger(x)C family spore germination protein n=1 Tax=Fictibacillus TaxID=1329200 RepID=UPI0004237734|nr:Ger(x)C family spore germination protein [Fictibacillus gelatini]